MALGAQPWLLETDRSPHDVGPQGAGKRESPGHPSSAQTCSSSGFSFSLQGTFCHFYGAGSIPGPSPASQLSGPGSPHSPVGSRECGWQTLRKVTWEVSQFVHMEAWAVGIGTGRVCLSLEGGLRGDVGTAKENRLLEAVKGHETWGRYRGAGVSVSAGVTNSRRRYFKSRQPSRVIKGLHFELSSFKIFMRFDDPDSPSLLFTAAGDLNQLLILGGTAVKHAKKGNSFVF